MNKLTIAEVVKQVSDSMLNQMEYGVKDVALLSFFKSKLYDEELVPKDRRQEILVLVNKETGLKYTFNDIKGVESPSTDIIADINLITNEKAKAKESNMNVQSIKTATTEFANTVTETATNAKDTIVKQFNTEVEAGEKSFVTTTNAAILGAVIGSAGVLVMKGLDMGSVVGGVVGAVASGVIVNRVMGNKEANITNLSIAGLAGVSLGSGSTIAGHYAVGTVTSVLQAAEEEVKEVMIKMYPEEVPAQA